MPRVIRVRPGRYEEHKTLAKISRESPHTRGFCDVRYIQEYYDRGWVGVAEQKGADGRWEVVGFTLVRHCLRKPWTSVYYVAVSSDLRGLGIGVKLFDWVVRTTPHPTLKLGVDENNEGAKRFWTRLGFTPCSPEFTVAKAGNRIYQYSRPKEITSHAE